MRIALDIDGVLADLTGAVVRRVNDRYGLYLRAQDIVKYRFINNLTDGDFRKRAAGFIKSLDLFDHLEPIPGAAQAVALLQDEGHEVYALTARSGDGFSCNTPAQVRIQTMKWLAREGMAVNGLVFTPKKNKPAAAKTCAVFVDDHLPTVIAAARANKGQRALLFDQPWNQDDKLPENVERVKGWDEIVAIIRERAEPENAAA